MSLSAILLVLLSAVCHSVWNLLAKSSGGPIAFMRQALRFSALCYAPLFLVFLFLLDYSPTYLVCTLSSGFAVGLFACSCGRQFLAHGFMVFIDDAARDFVRSRKGWGLC